jgi:LysR family transcriptional regulator, benzoate and cis,cis-muconate-responsive activator of ben and cat genes
MELRHLRYYVAVADELSFRKAADRLRVSRPALSKQIKDLEDEIGVKLLDRDTVSVSLTNAGEIFLSDARDILNRSDLAIERAGEAKAGHRGTLRIGSVGALASDFLPGTLKLFNQRYPAVEVKFVEMLPVEQLDALAKHTIDIGFAYGTDAGKRPDQNSFCVIQSTFGLAVSKQHPWAKRSTIQLSEVTDELLLFLGQGLHSVHRDDVCSFCQAEGFIPKKVRQIEGFDSLLTLIAADQGISLLPCVLDLSHQGVVIIPLSTERAVCEFLMWAVWQRESASPLVEHFVEILKNRPLSLDRKAS